MDNDAPQPEDFADFDSFNAAYQEWLEQYDDESGEYEIIGAEDIWQQYQEELNNG